MSPSALRRQIGQLLIAGFGGNRSPPRSGRSREFGLGGVILFPRISSRRSRSPRSVTTPLTSCLTCLSSISVDQEAGAWLA